MAAQIRKRNAATCHMWKRLHSAYHCRPGYKQPSDFVIRQIPDRLIPGLLELQYYQQEIRRLRAIQVSFIYLI
ncbi:unnamed protein product [Echinostoma caproni]|uniref:Histone domain-containing protein n=1 Tax=Echinostoma caproni TaxID=27848 RepID=A0A183B3T2_9TREM|nr:unnamed protein product [Echinostoma caproni]